MNESNAKDQALLQYHSIRDMMEAMGVDWERLLELRSLRAEWEAENPPSFIDPADPRASARWSLACPDEADELADLEDSASGFADLEDVERRIDEDPLSVEVRSGWTAPGEPMEATEFCILLCTGGPAVRIIGELNGSPVRAWIEYQDWGTPWTQLFGTDEDVLLAYAGRFLGY